MSRILNRNSTATLSLTGTILSGRGSASSHISHSSIEIKQLTGETVFTGSLNVILNQPILLSDATSLKFDKNQRLLWPARLCNIPVWIYRWQHAPLHVLEILSSINLRDRLSLRDGATVIIDIEETYTAPISLLGRVTWTCIWWGRPSWCYKRDRYYAKVKKWGILLGATQLGGPPMMLKRLAKRALRSAQSVPVLGSIANIRVFNIDAATSNKDRLHNHAYGEQYRPNRIKVEAYDTEQAREFARLRNLLEYTKVNDSSYSAKLYPAGYHTIDIDGNRLQGQRDPKLRFSRLGIDFREKVVLDLGTNQGGMLFFVRDEIRLGVGLDYNPRMVNAANRISTIVGSRNLNFYVFDLERDPLEMVFDLVPGGRVDIVFLLSVCMWIKNWKSVVQFCAENIKMMVFESNGTDEEQKEQELEIRAQYSIVTLVAEQSDDDPRQKNRKLFLCENAG